MDLMTAILVIALLLMVVKLMRSRSSSFLASLPGPPGVPLLGNLLQIDPQRPHVTMMEWSRVYGPVYRLDFGVGRRLVVVCGPERVREALADRALAGRPRPFRASAVTNQYRNLGFIDPTSPQWKPLRNIVRREIKATDVVGLHRLETVTSDVLDSMSADIIADGQGGLVNPRRHLYSAAFNIICAFLVGAKYNTTDVEFSLFQRMERLGVQLITSAGGSGAEVDALPWLRHLRHPVLGRMKEYEQVRDELYQRLKQTAEARAQHTNDNVAGANPLIWSLLTSPFHSESENGVRETFSEEYIKGTFSDILNGGTASTTNLTYSFLNILLHHREVYSRLKQELAEVAKNHCCGDDQHFRPTLADRADMPYTQAMVFELLRYVSIAPFTVPHKAIYDTTLGGFQIPSGTEVMINLWSVHHDEFYWKDPSTFDPTRFLDPASGDVVPPQHPARKGLVPFGAGPRRCIGEAFGMSRLFLVVSGILADFDLLPPPEVEISKLVPCDPCTYDLGMALYPKDFSLLMIPTETCTKSRFLKN